ncbi:MAG: LamG-like jellyroll fold domain-containing protein, partial [Candidatus Nanopelagicales bacterium]
MAREFDGVDDFISYSHISAFDGIAAIAISCWIRPEDGGSNWSGPFDAMGASTGEGTTHGWAVQKEDADETTCFLAFRNANADAVQGLTGSLTLSTWRHLYIRYDGSLAGDQRLRFWVDGVQNSATNANTPATLGTNDQVFQLAKSEGTLFW